VSRLPPRSLRCMRRRIDLGRPFCRAPCSLPDTVDGQPPSPASAACPATLDELRAVIIRAATIVTVMLVAACAPSAPRPVVQHRPQPPQDWFHQQLAAAVRAKRTHQPASDVAGAQKAYDDIVQAACVRLAVSGSRQYSARCDAVLRHAVSQPQFDPAVCDDTETDPAALRACND
jgi:hypothetical protein